MSDKAICNVRHCNFLEWSKELCLHHHQSYDEMLDVAGQLAPEVTKEEGYVELLNKVQKIRENKGKLAAINCFRREFGGSSQQARKIIDIWIPLSSLNKGSNE